MMPTIYLIRTDTGSLLTRIIKTFSKETYNHISLALDKDLTRTYSFGRKNPNNPLVGGFAHEDVSSDFFGPARCQIYTLEVSEDAYHQIERTIDRFDQQADILHYNLFGLVTAWLGIPWERPQAYFCSEFVSTTLVEAKVLDTLLPASVIDASYIIDALPVTLLYEGTLNGYKAVAPPLDRFHRLLAKVHLRFV